ncbi:MAG: hypothetical protein JNM33_17110 [Rubrivivax sp.]|nr:hypothetical protein [Rubrivivax sp.]
MDPVSSPPPAPPRRTGILKRPCPHCGQVSLRRVGGRRKGEGLSAPRAGYGRVTHMRCTAEGCGFEGWVPRRANRRRAAWWTRRRVRRLAVALRPLARAAGLLGLIGLGASVGAAVGSAWERAHAPTPAEVRAVLPPGEYHDGDPLPAAHPLAQPAAVAAAPLDLRGACVWGRPGRNPYRGSVSEALRSAKLPAAAQAQIVAKVAAKRPDGRLVIANDGIREEGSTRVFAASGFAMTYGRTLCLETRVNFPAGHSEAADLYEAQDERGRRVSVMVPDVCGNVSVIGGSSSSSEELRLRGLGGAMPSQLKLTTLVGGGEDDPAHAVPAPGTLACVLAGLLAWAGVRWRRRGRAVR